MRMKSVFLLVTLLVMSKFQAAEVIYPAEFDKQEAIWLAWSFDSAKKDFPYCNVQINAINAITSTQKVKLIVHSQKELNLVQKIINAECPFSDRVSYFVFPTSTIWFRDTSPTFLLTNSQKLNLLQFNDNQWGYEDTPSLENKTLVKKLAKKLNVSFLRSPLISEGGNREVNGRGTLLVVESVELSRNPGKTKEELEKEYVRTLCIKKVIWLKQGLLEDENPTFGLLPGPQGAMNYYTPLTPGGHIDAFCRFVGPNTILLAEVKQVDLKNNPIAEENNRRLEENFQILKNAKDPDGLPFEIIRMPIAEPMISTFKPGDVFYDYLEDLTFRPTKAFPQGKFPKQEEYFFYLTTSYLNFLITNESVISAKYWREGLSEKIREKDREAETILQKVFPDKKIIAIDVYNINLAGGGIHCMTQYEPKSQGD